MNPFLKRFLLILGIFFLVLILGALAVTTLFQDAIGQRIVKEINKQIKTELKVGDFRLSLFRAFPSAAATLKSVELYGAHNDLLLDAGEVSFRIGYASIFGAGIKVNSVLVANGALRVLVDEQGKAGYDIFEASQEEDTGNEGGFSVSLKKARLQNVLLFYENRQTGQNLSVQVESLDLSGEFSEKAFGMTVRAGLRSHFIDLAGIRYLPDKEIGINALLDVDLERGTYDFRNFGLQVEKNLFVVDGVVTTLPDGTRFDLFFDNEGGHLDDLVQLLPAQYLSRFGDLSSKGDFFFEGRVDGLLSERLNPDIRFKFGLQNGKLESDLMPSGLSNVSFEARFTNGKSRNNATTEFEIKNFNGLFGRQPVDFHLLVRNLDDPMADFSLDGVVPIETVAGLLGSTEVKDGSGEIEIQGLSLKGRYSDMIDPARMSNVLAQGRIEFDDASLEFEKEKLTFDRGVLEINGNLLTLNDLKLEGAGSDISLNGSCANLIPVLLNDSIASQGAKLRFDANWRSETLDIDRFLAVVNPPSTAQPAAPAAADTLAAPQAQAGGWFATHLDGVFECQVKEFNYGKTDGRYFIGKIIFDENTMLIEGNAEAMGGRFNLSGSLALEERLSLQARFDCAGVNVKEFFRQTGNFGQSVLQDRHIDGTLSAKMALFADFDENGHIILPDLLVFAGIGIENGELRDFDMLNNFSSYVKVEDLRHIRFVNMQNYLEIRNGRLYLPAMFIQSSAMNLTVSGEHSFDNEIDYNIKVNAGQVLATKFKKYNPGLEPIKAKGGLVNLYFKIYGTVDEFAYKTAKKEVKNDFEASERRKNEIKNALRQAFGSIDLIQEPAGWGDEGEALEGF